MIRPSLLATFWALYPWMNPPPRTGMSLGVRVGDVAPCGLGGPRGLARSPCGRPRGPALVPGGLRAAADPGCGPPSGTGGSPAATARPRPRPRARRRPAPGRPRPGGGQGLAWPAPPRCPPAAARCPGVPARAASTAMGRPRPVPVRFPRLPLRLQAGQRGGDPLPGGYAGHPGPRLRPAPSPNRASSSPSVSACRGRHLAGEPAQPLLRQVRVLRRAGGDLRPVHRHGARAGPCPAGRTTPAPARKNPAAVSANCCRNRATVT